MSRRPGRRRAQAQSQRPFGLLLTAVGVIVAGFGIGAVVAALRHPGGGSSVADVPRVTPVPVVARAAPRITAAPRETPSPAASPLATPSPTPSPSPAPPSPSAKAAGPESPSPQPHASVPAPAAAPTAVQPSPSPAPLKTPARTLTPSSPPAKATPRAAAAEGPIVDARTPAEAGAVRLVRTYLAAIANGDLATAYAALGGAPGDKGLATNEEEFMDRKARLLRIHASQRGEASATVEVEIASSKGNYYATFRVEPGERGTPVIESHDFIRP